MPEVNYIVSLAVLDPAGNLPSLSFATANYINSGRHPLVLINTSNNTVKELPQDFNFDDPLSDNRLYYDDHFDIFNYTITSDTPNGLLILKPAGGTYAVGTEVTVTAVGDLGYEFASWGSEFSDSENSFTFVMNGVKSISAHFNEIPTYELTVNAPHGSVNLYPEGGVYNKGTVVKIGYTADIGYNFSGWTGDITGTLGYIEVLMDSDKFVTAEFENPNHLFLTINSTNGSVRVTPERDIYIRGATVVLVATPR